MAVFGKLGGVVWNPRPGGIRELEMLIERGMEAGAEVVADRARANIAPYRDTGAAEDSIHLNTEHLGAWPRPVVFVGSASGDSFFIHEGTVDTPYRPYLAEALDSTIGDFPRLMRAGTQSVKGLGKITNAFRGDQGIRREG
jgi:hypothetical protein